MLLEDLIVTTASALDYQVLVILRKHVLHGQMATFLEQNVDTAVFDDVAFICHVE